MLCHVQLNSRGISPEDGLREAWMDQINQAYADGLNVKDCKGRSPLQCTIREGNTKSKSWGVHAIIVRRKAFVSHNFEIKKLQAKNVVYIKNETQTAGNACNFWMMSKHTDASKRFKHMTSGLYADGLNV